MRSDGENRIAATFTQLAKIIEAFESSDFCAGYIQHDYISTLEPYFCCGDEQNSHRRGVREHLLSIKHGIVKSDGEDTEAQRLGALEQLVRGIIDHILRIIERMDVKIDFHPIRLCALALDHALAFARSRACALLLAISRDCISKNLTADDADFTAEKEQEHE